MRKDERGEREGERERERHCKGGVVKKPKTSI
jgi:hypothetical protein